LLTKRIAERCKQKINTIFYFYGSKDACSECVKQGYVLDALREKYQALRVYSFDYNLDLSTIKALNSIYKIQNTLPSLVVNGKTVSGFKTVEELESLLPKELTSPQKAVTKKVSN
jgi:glutaredoxin